MQIGRGEGLGFALRQGNLVVVVNDTLIVILIGVIIVAVRGGCVFKPLTWKRTPARRVNRRIFEDRSGK